MKKLLTSFLSLTILFCGTFAQQNDSTLVVAKGQEAELAYNKGLEFFSQNNIIELLQNSLKRSDTNQILQKLTLTGEA